MAPLSDADRAQWAFGTGLPHQPCPRQNGFAERMIGLIWRRDIDHIVVLTEALAPDLAILLYYNSSEHIGYWIKMRRSLARFSGLESSVHTRCSAAWSALLKRKLQRQPRQSLLVPGAIATGRRRNHSWPEALKREIVAASFAPGSSVSMAARHYDVNANQVLSWRKRYRDEPRAPAGGSAPQLIPVTVTAETTAVATAPSTVTETIEIDLAGKYRVRIRTGVDAQVRPAKPV
jgi:transposase